MCLCLHQISIGLDQDLTPNMGQALYKQMRASFTYTDACALYINYV